MRKGQVEPDYWGSESGERIIVCVGEHDNRAADWSSMEQIMTRHAVPCVRGSIGSRPVMYGFLQTGKMEAFRKAVFRAGLTHLYDAAYPSGELASLVNTALRDGTCTFSTLYSQFMLVEQYEFPGIFLVSDSDPREDNARAIYVGYSAKSISFNIWSYPGQIPFRRGKGTPLPSPFTEYARAQADVSHSWIVTIFPQDLCLRMAIAGHIIPGFERDRNATENCLRKRYEDAELMLVHAQEALTALVRPSLNTNGMYPRELLEERKNGTK